MRETDAGRSTSPRLPVTTWAPYTGPGGARGVGLFDADDNIIAGLHKQTAGGELRPPGSTTTAARWEPARRSRGGTSNIGRPNLAIYSSQPLWSHTGWNPRPMPMSRAQRRTLATRIKAGEIMEKIPEGLPDIAHMTAEETWDLVKAGKVCTILVCYVTLADLRRHGLMLP